MFVNAYWSCFLEYESLNPAGKMDDTTFYHDLIFSILISCHAVIAGNYLHNPSRGQYVWWDTEACYSRKSDVSVHEEIAVDRKDEWW
jgi:hypothetical protein